MSASWLRSGNRAWARRSISSRANAAGIVFAATITALLGFPMWVDIVVEYAFCFAFGLFIFQALFMKDMMGGSYRTALSKS